MEFKSPFVELKNRKVNTWCRRTQRLDTYGCGCSHNCRYCYARGLLGFRGKWNPTNPRVADILKIFKVVSCGKIIGPIRMGGMTDCFQPIELSERVTFCTILILNYYRIPYLIVTKSDIVSRNEYIEIYDKGLAHFQISICCTNDEYAATVENAPSVKSRIKTIEKLHSLGFDVSVRLSPFMVDHVDFDTLNAIKCNKILIEFLKLSPHVIKNFSGDYSKYTLKYGGYLNLQLSDKIFFVDRITGFKEKSVGEYVKEHDWYFRNFVNANPNDCCNIGI